MKFVIDHVTKGNQCEVCCKFCVRAFLEEGSEAVSDSRLHNLGVFLFR